VDVTDVSQAIRNSHVIINTFLAVIIGSRAVIDSSPLIDKSGKFPLKKSK
jgi:hypothetical protein